MKMNFSTENLRNVFADENKLASYQKLCYDLRNGNKIYDFDEDGNKVEISKKDANRAIRKVLMEICGLDEETVKSAKRRHRAIDRHMEEIFELHEEDIDFKVEEGFKESEWFNELVENRNIALGDDEEYWTKDKITFIVAEISGDHHDLTMQNLNEGTPYRLHTTKHGIRVGADIDLVLLGRKDFTELTDKIAEAFIYDVQTRCYTAVYGAAAQLPNPSQFNKTGVLNTSTKSAFDTLITDVAIANDATDVVIYGTKLALKALNALTDVDWRADSQKESVAATGRLGSYEGTLLVELPQRFALNTTTERLFDDNMLLILPRGEEKFVKFTDKGETEIFEVTEKADMADDFRTYEVQREYGVGVQIGNYFGKWEIDR